jgi:hypothetical protein
MQLRTEIDIDAPAREVWEVLTNFRAYPEWNPFITSVRGKPRVGQTLEVVLSPPRSREMKFTPEVLRVDPFVELRWRGVLYFDWLFVGEHFFQLKEIDARRTRLVHGEDFSGWLAKIISFTNTTRGFVFMNQALKKRVEGRGAEER